MNHRRLVEGEVEEYEPGHFQLRMVDLVSAVEVLLYAWEDRGWVHGSIGFDGARYFFTELETGSRVSLQAGMPMRAIVTIH